MIDLHNQIKQMVTYFDGARIINNQTRRKNRRLLRLPFPLPKVIRLSFLQQEVLSCCSISGHRGVLRAGQKIQISSKPGICTITGDFKIYQVSLDKTKEAWIKGIQDDGLEKWIHVSDVRYWNSIVVPLYKIESIPANYLLDREGRIIATNLRGDALQRKLAELFK